MSAWLTQWRTTILAFAISLNMIDTAYAAITTTGNVTPDPSTTTGSNDLFIGNSVPGTMLVNTGSDVVANASVIGNGAFATGTATITGADSTWTNIGALRIGFNGSGSLEIRNGGHVSSLFGVLGSEYGSTGTAIIDGAGSQWIDAGDLYVGDHGTGTMTISNGGYVRNGKGVIGIFGSFGATGAATVDGVGSSWINTGDLYVSYDAHGTLNIRNGGSVTNEEAVIGVLDPGAAMVEGAGSTWTSNKRLLVGAQGDGALSITAGAQVNVAKDTVVSGFGGQGRITFSNGMLATGALLAAREHLLGTGTIYANGTVMDIDLLFNQNNGLEQSLVLNGLPGQSIAINLDVDGTGSIGAGYVGQGSLTVADNRDITSTTGYLGVMTGSKGVATVSGLGSTWTNSENFYVGYNGEGTLTISNGGSAASATGNLGYLAGSSGTLTVTGAGSTWTNSSTLQIGGNGIGILNIAKGGKITSSDDVFLGYASGSGFVTVDGSSTLWTIGKKLTVNHGLLSVTNGSHVSSMFGGIDSVSGSVLIDGAGSSWVIDGDLNMRGSLEISGGGRVSNRNSSSIGNAFGGPGGSVTVTGSGSSWTNTGPLLVNSGGALSVTNGGFVSNFNGFIGSGFGSPLTAVVTVEGAGSTWRNSNLQVGDYSKGILNISNGGTVIVSQHLTLGYNSSVSGIVNLSGGLLSLQRGSVTKGAGAATFNFTGGRLEGAGTIDIGTALVQNGGTLAPGNTVGVTTIQNGYTLNAGSLEIEINALGAAGTNWDQLIINGTVDLLGSNGAPNGALQIVLGFAPTVGSQFLVVENDGIDPINGTFATGSLVKALYGDSIYQFAIIYAAGSGNDVSVITQSVSLLRDYGDFNADGVVDSADYVVWRQGSGIFTQSDYANWRLNFGKILVGNASPTGDFNDDGVVDAADYVVWRKTGGSLESYNTMRAHFGESANAGGVVVTSTSPTAIPEPASSLHLVLVVAVCLIHRRRVASSFHRVFVG